MADVTPGWGGCILRTVGIDRDGYGLIRESGGKTRRAHRVAYELLVGAIPQGFHLDHLCHTRDLACPGGPACLHRRCINPEHLEPVTSRENTIRGGNSRKTHCVNGHEFTDANTRIDVRGSRACRACNQVAVGRYKARKAAVA
ncbi:HNH endonuclease signature motif containing protein [Streptomyces sp. NPDC059016]|uniref:HNH endonuclease signature motif containing protein n=1 Tax=Streptomyces sp. NPDC059016 TaxID=3346699 RepID=UPI00367AAC70